MAPLLKWTGIGKLVSFYRYIYFSGPGVVLWSGIGLILAIGAIHIYEAPEHYRVAKYLGYLFGVLFAGTLLSALGMLRGGRWGWVLGTLISGTAFVAYFVSRILGLPGYEEAAAGAWDEPFGTAVLVLEALFISLYFSVITGMNVAAPSRRDWHD